MKGKSSGNSGTKKDSELGMGVRKAVMTQGFQKVVFRARVIDKLFVREMDKLLLVIGAQPKKWYTNHQQEYYVPLQMKLKHVFQQKAKLSVLTKM